MEPAVMPLLVVASPGGDAADAVLNAVDAVVNAVTNPVGTAVGAVGGGLVDLWASAIAEAAGESFIHLGTWWVRVQTPTLFGAGSDAQWVQDRLAYIAAAMVLVSIIVAGIQMAWYRRAEPARELLRSLLTFIGVSGAGTAAAHLVVQAADAFAVWMIDSVTSGSAEDFGTLIVKSQLDVGTAGVSKFVIIVMGLLALIANLVQMALMMLRSALLPLLVAALPFAASATNTTWGKAWLTKIVGWFAAFALFKPVAAIVYALAIRMTASGSTGGLDEFGQFMAGIFLMIASTVALPALVSFMVPATAAIASGGGGGGAGFAAYSAIQATGAITNRQASGAAGAQGATGATGPAGPAGAPGAAGASGAATTGGAGAAGGGSAAASSGGAAAAGGGSTAAAAAGPIGMAAAAAYQVGSQAVGASRGAVTSATGAASAPAPAGAGATPPPSAVITYSGREGHR